MAEEIIKHTFYHWGPLLYSTMITQERLDELLKLCKKASIKKNKDLAGHITKELKLPHDKVLKILKPYFKSYAKVTLFYYGYDLPHVTLTSSWVNYMKNGEFNPPHVHGGLLSFVLYGAIPEKLRTENKKHIGTSMGPGGIEFVHSYGAKKLNICTRSFFPEEKQLFIFPAHLHHWVYPFNANVNRLSISGNLEKVEPDA